MRVPFNAWVFLLLAVLATGCAAAPSPTDTLSPFPTDINTPAPSQLPYPENTYYKISQGTVPMLGITGYIISDYPDQSLINISPDGKKALIANITTGDSTNGITVYDMISKEAVMLDGDFVITNMIWSLDSTKIAMTTGTIRDLGIWDVSKNEFVVQNIKSHISNLFSNPSKGKLSSLVLGGPDIILAHRWAKNGNQIVVSNNSGMYVWNIDSEKLTAGLVSNNAYGLDIQWHPDGNGMGSLSDNILYISRTNSTTIEQIDAVDTFSWSPSGIYLAVISTGGELTIQNDEFENIFQFSELSRRDPKLYDVYSWARNQERILIQTEMSNQIIDIASSESVEINGTHTHWNWSPDDKLIVGYTPSNKLIRWEIYNSTTGESLFQSISPLTTKSWIINEHYPRSFWIDNGHRLVIDSELWAIPKQEVGITSIDPGDSNNVLDPAGIYIVTLNGSNAILHTRKNDSSGTAYFGNGEVVEIDLSEELSGLLLSWDSYLDPEIIVYTFPDQPMDIFITSHLVYEYFTINHADPISGNYREIWNGIGPVNFDFLDHFILIDTHSCYYCDGFSLYRNGAVIINTDTNNSLDLNEVGNVSLDLTNGVVSYQELKEIEVTTCEDGDDLCDFIPYVIHEPMGETFTQSLP